MILEIFAVENLCCVPVLLRSFGGVGCLTWFHHACSCPYPCPPLPPCSQYYKPDFMSCTAVWLPRWNQAFAVCAAEMIDAATFAVFLVL
jgi:hypothetical protein